ncbi:MAG: hypothetical protein MUO76_00130, partial [Anaerolineaceae bacterium]|nr:hypothetical protein [Anaerolineaceae bacterium]
VGGSPGIVVSDRKTDQVVWRGHGWLAGQPDERGDIFYLSIQDSGPVYHWCLHGSTQTDFKIKLNLPEWVNQRRFPELVDLSAKRDALVLGFNDYPGQRSYLAALDVKNGQPHWQVERDSRLERWCLRGLAAHRVMEMAVVHLGGNNRANPPLPWKSVLSMVDLRNGRIIWSHEGAGDLKSILRFSSSGSCLAWLEGWALKVYAALSGDLIWQTLCGMNSACLAPFDDQTGVLVLRVQKPDPERFFGPQSSDIRLVRIDRGGEVSDLMPCIGNERTDLGAFALMDGGSTLILPA